MRVTKKKDVCLHLFTRMFTLHSLDEITFFNVISLCLIDVMLLDFYLMVTIESPLYIAYKEELNMQDSSMSGGSYSVHDV